MRSILFLFILAAIFSCSSEKHDPLPEVKLLMKTKMDSMQIYLVALQESVNKKKPIEEIQNNFLTARKYFKKGEALNEFYFPLICEFMNGPALDEADEYDDKETEATGFQVIEEYIFPAYDTTVRKDLQNEIETLLQVKTRFDQLLDGTQLTDRNIFEAIRLELLRITSLGVSGFDSPIAQQSIPEALAALRGMEEVLKLYMPLLKDETSWIDLQQRFEKAYSYLKSSASFNEFNRAEFIVTYIKTLSKDIYTYQNELAIANNEFLVAINLNNAELFSGNDFNECFFTPSQDTTHSKATINLGKALFFDPILSGNNKRSCASCHQPTRAFAENKAKSIAFTMDGEISRNAPTLINAGFQKSQFWDQRVNFIEDQVSDVMMNVDEMHGDPDKSFHLLMKSKEYTEMFGSAFGTEKTFISRNIRQALAAYIRSLKGMNSRFDLYLKGDKSKLTYDEITGFNLFMGKAKCGTCHFMPLFNGTVPPNYNESESEVLGVPGKADTINAKADSDLGKYNAYKRTLFKNAFKTPTIRNAALTGPYMHNGVYKTLEEVMDFYNRGGGAGIGIQLPNQTLPPDKLGLTLKEQNQVIAFIHTLTDTTGLTSVPKKLPLFKDVKLDKRFVGGQY